MVLSLNRFDLVSLRLYTVVLDAGSLTAGAGGFGISLAAASKRIAELENHCGVQLLERRKQGVVATPAGTTFYRHAIAMVAGLEQLALAMGDYSAGARGHVRLWANTSAVNGFLPALLAEYGRQHPGVKLDLEEALSDDVANAVMRGSADLGVFAENTRVDGLTTTVCDADELVLLARRDLLPAVCRRVRFSELLDLDFVTMSRGASLVRLLSAAALAEGKALKVRVQLHSFDAVCRMVAEGLGVAILPRAAATPHAASMRLRMLPVDEPWAARRLVMGVRAGAALAGPAQTLAAAIAAHGLATVRSAGSKQKRPARGRP